MVLSSRSTWRVEGSLVLLSLFATASVAAVAERSAPGGSWHFTALADWLTGTPLPSPQPIQVRDLGYPLFIVLMGKNPNAVIAAQFLMAAALPLLVFWQVAWANRTMAWIAGCLTILSLAPYQFVAWFHHDQLFIFALVASCTLTIWTLRTPSTALIMLTAASWLVASLSRPAANFSGLFCLALLAIIVRERRRTIVAVALAFAVAFTLYGQWRTRAIAKAGVSDYAGSQLFFAAYVIGGREGVNLRDAGDPATIAVVRSVEAVVPKLVRRTPDAVAWLTAYGYDPQTVFPPSVFSADTSSRQAVDFIFAHPTQAYYELVNFSTGNDYGLMGRAAAASFTRHPFAYLRAGIRQSLLLLWKPGWTYTGFTTPLAPQLQKQLISVYFLGRNTADGQLALLPQTFSDAFAQRPETRFSDAVDRLARQRWVIATFSFFDEWLTKTVLIAFLLGVIVAALRRSASLLQSLVVIGIPHLLIVGITGLTVSADYRYHFMALSEAIALGGLGCCALIEAIESRAPRRLRRFLQAS